MDEATLELSLNERMGIVRRSPVLRYLPEGTLQAVATSARLVIRVAGEPFYTADQAFEDRSAFVLVHGYVTLRAGVVLDRDESSLTEPGSLFGIDGILSTLLGAGFKPELVTLAAVAEEHTWALQITPQTLAQVFDGSEGREAAVQLANGYAQSRDRDLLDKLRSAPVLRGLREELLREMLIYSEVRHFGRGERLDLAEGDATLAWLVLLGQVEEHCSSQGPEGGAQVCRHGEGSLVGLDRLALGPDDPAPPQSMLQTPEGGTLLQIDGRCIDSLLSRSRAMKRAVELERSGSSGDGAVSPFIVPAEMTLVLPDKDLPLEELPLSGLVRMLAATVDEHLDDRACVLELHWKGDTEVVTPQTARVPTFVETIDPPAPDCVDVERDLRKKIGQTLQDFSQMWGTGFAEVFVDPVALLLAERVERKTLSIALARSLEDVLCPAGISYLFDDPAVWRNLPLQLGIVLQVEILPTVLLGPARRIRVLQEMLAALRDEVVDLKQSNDAIADEVIRALPAMLRRPAQRLRDRWASATARLDGMAASTRAWPMRAVRLRISPEVREVIESRVRAPMAASRLLVAGDGPPTLSNPQADHLEQTLRRWARAVTSRRVGIAIGGAGAQSYCSIPFLQQLVASGVPVDMMAACSMGAYISAFFCSSGFDGLDEIVDKWWVAEIGVLLAWIDNSPLSVWVSMATDGATLEEMEIPMIAVAAAADSGHPVLERAGRTGPVCTASGALPPTSPSYRGPTRLLDGGLVIDVPTQILRDVGCDLVIGINSVPPVDQALKIPRLPIPGYATLLKRNPLVRAYDYQRGYLMLFHQAARSGNLYADVLFNPTFRGTNAGYFWQARRIISETSRMPSLGVAIATAVNRWQELRQHPGSRLLLAAQAQGWELDLGSLNPAPRVEGRAPELPAGQTRYAVTNLCKILKAYPDYCAVFTIRVSSSVPGRIKPAKLATTFGRKVIDFFEKQGVERERLKAVPEVTTEVPWLDVRVLLVSPERFDEASEETS